jgi:large subunit ribosomal protein L22
MASNANSVIVTPRARAIQRGARQSPYKMRLVIDQIRGKSVNEALALLKFSKKHAAKQIEKTLASAVANAEHKARETNDSIDVDLLFVTHAVVNEGPSLKRFMPAAQGRATPIRKRTSHVEIVVGERTKKVASSTNASASAVPAAKKTTKKTAAKTTAAKKTTARKTKKTDGEQ